MNPKTAILYARVSSASQAEEEVSIPAQLDSGHRRAARDGVTILREFVDEGRSAYIESNRRQFEAAIDYAVAHEVGTFYTWSSSRFARNKFEAAKYKRELERAGVRLVYLSMSVDLSTDEGWLLDSFFEVMDEQRSRDTSKDTRRSLIHNAQLGYWVGGIAPFGYMSIPAPDNPRRRKLVLHPDESALAREVFDLRAAGLGAKLIADRFNSAGTRYRTRLWNKASVLHLLRNQALRGLTIFNKKEPRTGRARAESDWLVLQTHEALIEQELWDQVQGAVDHAAEQLLSQGRVRSGHPYSGGILRCGECGGALNVEKARGRSNTYSYYSCRTAKLGGPCAGKRYPAPALDEALNAFVFDRILTPETLREFALEMARVARQHDASIVARQQEIAGKVTALRDRNNKLYEVMETLGRETPNLADMTERLRANNAELKALEDAALRIDADINAPLDIEGVDFNEMGAELRHMLSESANPNLLRTFYASFIQSITIKDDQAHILYDPAKMVAATNPAVHSLQIWGRWCSPTRTAVLVLPVTAGCRPRRRIKAFGVALGR